MLSYGYTLKGGNMALFRKIKHTKRLKYKAEEPVQEDYTISNDWAKVMTRKVMDSIWPGWENWNT